MGTERTVDRGVPRAGISAVRLALEHSVNANQLRNGSGNISSARVLSDEVRNRPLRLKRERQMTKGISEFPAQTLAVQGGRYASTRRGSGDGGAA